MKKVWIIIHNNHLGYEEVEVESERKSSIVVLRYGFHNIVKNEDVFFREIDVINAIIARSADQLSFYRHCVTSEENKINQLIERKKYIL